MATGNRSAYILMLTCSNDNAMPMWSGGVGHSRSALLLKPADCAGGAGDHAARGHVCEGVA